MIVTMPIGKRMIPTTGTEQDCSRGQPRSEIKTAPATMRARPTTMTDRLRKSLAGYIGVSSLGLIFCSLLEQR